MNVRKGFLALALICIMVMQLIRMGPEVVYAEESLESCVGLKRQVVLEDTDECFVTDEKYSHASVTNTFYSEFTNDFYYSRLAANEQALYDALYMECQRLMLNIDNIAIDGYYEGTPYGLTSHVAYYGLTREQIERVTWIFQLSNPQFYFINGIISINTYWDGSSKDGSVALGIYGAFLDGNARATATSTVFGKVSQYVSQINTKSSQYDKEKMAYDLIISNTSYQYGTYDQSVYSVFVEGASVCAGYSLAFAMICNAVGIQTITVTSYSHEWNIVNIGGSWYYVDCTWGDDYYDRYRYLDIGTARMTSEDVDGLHIMESIWYGIVPSVSSSDFNPNSIGYSVMYRLYNPNSGEHFYTADGNERNYLDAIGWNYEGESWTAPSYSATPVYRMYNPVAGDHHYTINYAEVVNLTSLGWSFEGVGWYSSDSANMALYRLYNPNAVTGTHHYTANYGEAMYLQNIGWSFEGVGWYGK